MAGGRLCLCRRAGTRWAPSTFCESRGRRTRRSTRWARRAPSSACAVAMARAPRASARSRRAASCALMSCQL
eukprot:4191433-Prymnesium_polylepis.1